MNLQLDNLYFKYGRRRPFVLDDVTMHFNEGGVVGLLGPNGAGKSTLLYLIAGALTPTTGDVSFDGTSTRMRFPQTLSSIFLVPEEVTLPRMSLAAYVRTYGVFYPDFDINVMQECLKEFDMFEPERLDSLSMGQKKKVVLSFAIACHTPVLLMDEPTNGLDIPGKAAFRRLVARHASDDRLYLISTHQVRDLDQLLDRVMIMDTQRFILKESVMRLQQAFRFERSLPTPPQEALYTLPSIGGFDAILPNDDDSETEINLELLFDAAIKFTPAVNDVLSRLPEPQSCNA